VRPAATILLTRDTPAGVEVFMVKRHHQIDFMSGALVFPGGKIAPGDSDPRVRQLTDGADGFDDEELPFAACAIREAFEESGILLARKAATGAMLTGQETLDLDDARNPLNKEELGLADFLEQNGLRLAVDRLVRYARWITPVMVPKRFDTWFYIAAAPEGQLGAHDGHESVDSTWITPAEAMAEGSKWSIVFPTRMNLIRLAESATVEEALKVSAARKVEICLPRPERIDGKGYIRLPIEAGYGDILEPMGGPGG
jgi:8-oxo-dGTP pyrophosphatase MutT (NUDIX family)